MAQAQASAYNPTLRDQIAIWLLGDGRPSVARRNFVEGLLGSSGSGTKGGSLSDFTPAGILFSAQDAKRSFDNGAYGSAAWDAVGALPAGVVAGAVKKARNAARPLEDVIAKAFGGTLERASEAAARAAERSSRLEKTGLIRALQRAGRSPDEIRRALTEFDAANAYRETQPRLPPAETPRSIDASPAFDDAAATERVRAAHEMPAVATDSRAGGAVDIRAYAEMLDNPPYNYYENGPTKWLGPLGGRQGPTITQSYGWLTDPRRKHLRDPDTIQEAHKLPQFAVFEGTPGYNMNDAPSILMTGPSNVKGTQHYWATQAQREPGGGTAGAELPIIAKSLDESGALPPWANDQTMREVIQYLIYLKMKSDTPTRIPGNRKKPKSVISEPPNSQEEH